MKNNKLPIGKPELIFIGTIGIIIVILLGTQLQPAAITGGVSACATGDDVENAGWGATFECLSSDSDTATVRILTPWGSTETMDVEQDEFYSLVNPDNEYERFDVQIRGCSSNGACFTTKFIQETPAPTPIPTPVPTAIPTVIPTETQTEIPLEEGTPGTTVDKESASATEEPVKDTTSSDYIPPTSVDAPPMIEEEGVGEFMGISYWMIIAIIALICICVYFMTRDKK